VLVLIVALLGAGLTLRDPEVRLGAEALVNELSACLLRGEEPGRQLDLLAARRAQQSQRRAGRDVAPQPQPLTLPVVRPKAQLRAEATPHPDRPATIPRRVVVAVIDSGVTATHPDIGERNVLPGYDLVNPCGDGQQDVTGHGTAVAGVLLSGHHGAAPKVDVLPIRISLATGRHSSFSSAAAIVLAANRGADIINMSYTAQRRRPSVVEWLAVRYAHAKGAALVAAAGNDPTKPAGYPAAYPEVLSVTAIDRSGELSSFSARTGQIDVAAPGSRVLTLSPDGSVRVASGTSLAAPLVSASLVHLLRADPAVAPTQAVEAVRRSSEPERVLAHRFGTFNFSAALAGVCAISSACQLQGALTRSEPGPQIGDPNRLPRPGEPR
jgi:subtilisin family serine protease